MYNAMLHRYEIKHCKGTNFCGTDFLVLLREIFVQVLIFIVFHQTVPGLFSINATPLRGGIY